MDGFDRVVRALSGEPLTYTERSSPRHAIKGRVYTSTDYPPDEEIFLHNENSYQARWPLTLFFYCITAPQTLGATPLADIRRVYRGDRPGGTRGVRPPPLDAGAQLPRRLRHALAARVRHRRPGRGEAYAAANRIDAGVGGPDGLRTRAVRDVVHHRPGSDTPRWFNHATFFHVSTLAKDLQEGLLAMFGADGLPTNTYYGDGGEIPADVMDHLRAAYRAASVRFDYQRDDVLVVDNMTAAHGREPFTGPRKIAVAMAEPHTP